MKTGNVEYAPDYKSKEPRLPKDFGLLKAACADGKHRFLPDALKCGCGQVINPDAECERLRSEVIEAAKQWRREGHQRGFYTYPLSEKLRLREASDEALEERIDTLIEFESQHQETR